MIRFVGFNSSVRVLKEINYRLTEMLDIEFCFADEMGIDINDYFPSYLCRESPDKCRNIIEDLREWVDDYYLHDHTCLHEYVLYRIINNYFDVKEDLDILEQFKIENKELFTQEELEFLNDFQNRDDFIETLFWDLDFVYLDEIVALYQTDKLVFHTLGVNLNYYLDLLPIDIRKQIKRDPKCEENIIDFEERIINVINDTLINLSLRPMETNKFLEVELSNIIADLLEAKLVRDRVYVEREALVGHAPKRTGSADFLLSYKKEQTIEYLAIGENKFWSPNKFSSQINQLISYLNEHFNFGFTIVINKNTKISEIISKQKEILENFNINSAFQTEDILCKDGMLISIHRNAENNKRFRIYHFILNLYHPEREVAVRNR